MGKAQTGAMMGGPEGVAFGRSAAATDARCEM